MFCSWGLVFFEASSINHLLGQNLIFPCNNCFALGKTKGLLTLISTLSNGLVWRVIVVMN